MSAPLTRAHDDPGLQPERTVMSWGRTTLSLFVVSAVFLRWMPHYGLPILLLVVLAAGGALAIYTTQRRRYHTRAQGIAAGRFAADAAAVFFTAGAVFVLGLLALLVVLAT
ncbi:DUF202 domain-containing protein [Arthrobacter sp. JSM 101049]|uniref:DUF202 domain-containing protein n=1 Tax=Arthrobacter sp. JSM 101049 TaxID=929097 RepID=UPI00356688A4